nr:MAG TPA: hypothetical protein [Caudoviricetes sp.]
MGENAIKVFDIEKTIKRCEQLIKPENANWIGISNQEAIRELLNMLKEKDKEIEHQIEKRNNQKTELAILNEKQKEMNKLINTVKSYKGQMKKEIKRIKSLEKEAQKYFEEIIKQDRAIDLMAECIDVELSSARLGIILNKNVQPLENYKEDIKQYFKSKAEKE